MLIYILNFLKYHYIIVGFLNIQLTKSFAPPQASPLNLSYQTKIFTAQLGCHVEYHFYTNCVRKFLRHAAYHLKACSFDWSCETEGWRILKVYVGKLRRTELVTLSRVE